MNDKRQGVLLEWMLDKIEKNGRVDGSSFFCVFECEVQVGTSTATTVACQRDDDAGTDVGAFGDESLGEVAIADGDGRYDSLAVIRTASAASTRNRATLRSAFRSSPVSIKDWSFGSVNISRHDRDAMVIVSMSAGMSRYRFSVERSGR